jgi:hypothetical protein
MDTLFQRLITILASKPLDALAKLIDTNPQPLLKFCLCSFVYVVVAVLFVGFLFFHFQLHRSYFPCSVASQKWNIFWMPRRDGEADRRLRQPPCAFSSEDPYRSSCQGCHCPLARPITRACSVEFAVHAFLCDDIDRLSVALISVRVFHLTPALMPNCATFLLYVV